ncbi:MAG: zinc ribbon domain-containing protein [Spirochaetia bacterium]
MRARYFCENCGKEVNPRASTCPWCGRVFTAVRCPECGFEGKASDFRAGCPSCGFNQPVPSAPKTPAARLRPRRRSLPSPRFYKIAGVVLLVLLVALLGLLFLRA